MNINKFKNRLFGRKIGRSKKKIDVENYLNLLKQYEIKAFDNKNKYILDIGTGYGETTLFLSKNFQNHIIISCEKYINGNLSLIKKIKLNNISNIRIYPGNVHDLLDINSKKKYFDSVWIFFPDPWPKKKHFKRRLINSDFLYKLYPFIINNGYIYIATDSISYKRFILKSIFNSKNFLYWINQNEGHLLVNDYYDIDTKFYKKAIICGKKPSIFILKKL